VTWNLLAIVIGGGLPLGWLLAEVLTAPEVHDESRIVDI
jgi:hypothetical protein